MRNSIAFILLLIGSSIIELSVVNTLSYPYFLFPIAFSIGVLMFHTLPILYGILWFILLPIMLSILGSESINILPYIIVLIAGTTLTMRVFTRRSMYALLGLGIILISLLSGTQILFGNSPFGNNPGLGSFGWAILELIIALIVGFSLIQKLKPFGSLFLIPRKS